MKSGRAPKSDLNRCHSKAAGTTDLSKRAARDAGTAEMERRKSSREGGRRSVRSLAGFAF